MLWLALTALVVLLGRFTGHGPGWDDTTTTLLPAVALLFLAGRIGRNRMRRPQDAQRFPAIREGVRADPAPRTPLLHHRSFDDIILDVEVSSIYLAAVRGSHKSSDHAPKAEPARPRTDLPRSVRYSAAGGGETGWFRKVGAGLSPEPMG